MKREADSYEPVVKKKKQLPQGVGDTVVVKSSQPATPPPVKSCSLNGRKRQQQQQKQQHQGGQAQYIKNPDSESQTLHSSPTHQAAGNSSVMVEGAVAHVAHGDARYVVPFMVNGDRIFARRFVYVQDAEAFAKTDAGIQAWKAAHPEDESLLGKVIECY